MRVSHLLSGDALSAKSLAAWRRTRVVTVSWLWESVRLGRLEPAEAHAVPPTDAVARLLWTCGTHDRDHWSHAFLRNALLYF